ncbi:hypothetical protein CLG96_07685 [Sphingomonas oleivorans]|uniref:PilZ domain-containing protein n=1 Tax=Sphingomonas oleivorans TaxID=1735121 RepID=A0A2T5FYY4_9SPHN|nr:hypothetical protein [Sphingomonas oleivorans]PTQ11799.1 hypothetical protein CLG96_07685 [Sphingomonas oleivorans]
MAITAKLFLQGAQHDRPHVRQKPRPDGDIRMASHHRLDIVLHDLSVNGFSAEVNSTLPVDQQVWLKLPDRDPIDARIIRRRDRRIDARFAMPLDIRTVADALKAGSARWAPFPIGRPISEPRAGHRAQASSPYFPLGPASADHWPRRRKLIAMIVAALLLWTMIFTAISRL